MAQSKARRAEQPCGRWIAVLVCALLMPIATSSQAYDQGSQPPPTTAYNSQWEPYFAATGVSAILTEFHHLIAQEIDNLSHIPMGLTTAELTQIRARFMAELHPRQLKANMSQALKQQLSLQEQSELAQVLEAKFLRQLQRLEAELAQTEVRRAMRSYQWTLKNRTPLPARVALLDDLNVSLGQSALEAELKVELRKHLLAVIATIKGGEVVPEGLLDQQLANYRDEVALQISDNARAAYLYLLKQVPSSELRNWVSVLNEPVYSRFMTICQQTLSESFRYARRELVAEARLVMNAN